MNQAIIDRQVGAMRAQGLDALIAISPENVAYTTGFLVPSPPLLRWRHCLVVVTATRRLGMVVVDMEEFTVRDRVPIQDIRSWNEFTENPMDRLAELVTDLKLALSRIG
ncbi:MAG: aminopeptidase P family N-terminal domain-containing protein, partial [Deltaproteobacteria bacterium]|nr:aminopeptidase P family N-terminal domain-containing protein [Deltaproteobacteria bacterium]